MVVDLLERAVASTDPERIALVSHESVWTFAELQRSVDERALALSEEGLAAGEIRPFVAETNPEGIVTLLACWRLGATAAPLNPSLTERERFAAQEVLTRVSVAAQAILWTSGTSGRPRGVALSHDNLISVCRAVGERLELGASDCWLASLSLAHVGGLVLVVRALLTGSCVVAAGRFDPAAASGLLDGTASGFGVDARITHMSLVPTQLLRLLEHRRGEPPSATFRCALIGGAHALPELVDRALADGWPLALTYGMTEMTSQVATAPPGQVRAKPGTVGKTLTGVELKIAEDGEIYVRGPTQALTYVGPEASAICGPEGWYRTGDFGGLDEDGDLWVTGRRSDRIVSGGVTIDATEVETVLRTHPGVEDVCVVGLPDAEWGEIVAAAVVATANGIDSDELQRDARTRLGPAKRPRVWRLEHSLPRNVNGKVDRAAVRELFVSEQ